MRVIPYRALYLLSTGVTYATIGLVLLLHTAQSDLPVFRSFPSWLDDNEHGVIWLVGGIVALLPGLVSLLKRKTPKALEKAGFIAGLIPPLFSAAALLTLVTLIPPGALVLLLLCGLLSVINLIVASWPDPKIHPKTESIPLPPKIDLKEN